MTKFEGYGLGFCHFFILPEKINPLLSSLRCKNNVLLQLRRQRGEVHSTMLRYFLRR